MNTQPTAEDIAAIQDLLSRSALKAVEYHELAASVSGLTSPQPDSELNLNLSLQHRCAEDGIGFRLVGIITSEVGEARATVAATYDYEGHPPTQRALFGFANEVAVMTIFPYLREAIATITSRVFGQPVLLPVLSRGEVGYDLDDASNEVVFTA